MRIPLTGLTGSRKTFHHRGQASQYLDDAETFGGDISIRAEVYREGGMLHVDLSFELPGQFTCDRCGQPFVQQHSGRDDFFFSLAGSSETGEDPETPMIPKGAVEIDVSQEIRDLVILSLPFQLVCRADCKGLCPRCGANLNLETCRCQTADVDPRWEKLRSLSPGGSS